MIVSINIGIFILILFFFVIGYIVGVSICSRNVRKQIKQLKQQMQNEKEQWVHTCVNGVRTFLHQPNEE